jgi:glycosyltransferase involved in cell wall biosynthesis
MPLRPTLIAAGIAEGEPPATAVRRMIDEDQMPDILRIGVALNHVDLNDPAPRPSGWRGRLLAALPPAVADTWLRRSEIGAVLSWGENIAFPVAALIWMMRLLRIRRPGHIAILMVPFHEGTTSPVKRVLKSVLVPLVVHGGMDRVDVPAPLQRRWARERWRLPADRFVLAQWPVDTAFWRPIDGAGDLICAVGREMRDYTTLIEALRSLEIPCHIAAGTAVNYGGFGTDDPDAENVAGRALPDTVTVGPKSLLELRELYARSRMVIVPVLPSNSDNGISTIMEAMAMGRAIVTTDTDGRAEILEHEVNCLLVPPRDAQALRAAIKRLWDDPELCARLGSHAREQIVDTHGLGQWLDAMLGAVAEISRPAS